MMDRTIGMLLSQVGPAMIKASGRTFADSSVAVARLDTIRHSASFSALTGVNNIKKSRSSAQGREDDLLDKLMRLRALSASAGP
jgi:hypothetical protein